jgi:SnoaL-like protein
LRAHFADYTVDIARVRRFSGSGFEPGVFDEAQLASNRARNKNSREDDMRRRSIMRASVSLAVAAPVVAIAQSALPEIKRQPSAQAVLDEHMDALNHCDWSRILAQYPDDAQINLPGGTVVSGRKAIGEMFTGFCKDSKDGGLKGIYFKVEHSTTIGDTFATQWVATADFLAEPYRGSDAYIPRMG